MPADHARTDKKHGTYHHADALGHLRAQRQHNRRRPEVRIADQVAGILGPSIVDALPGIPRETIGTVALCLAGHLAELCELGLTNTKIMANAVGAVADDLLSGAEATRHHHAEKEDPDDIGR